MGQRAQADCGMLLHSAWKKRSMDHMLLCHTYGQSTQTPRSEISSEARTQIGIEYFWVDRWCIKQDDERDKAAEIPRMADYYSRAATTIILLDMVDSRVRGGTYSCYKALSHQQLNDLKALANEISYSSWAKRVWTFQEGWVGRNPIIKTKHQWIDAGLVELGISTGALFMKNHCLITPAGISFTGGVQSGGLKVETANGIFQGARLVCWRQCFALRLQNGQ